MRVDVRWTRTSARKHAVVAVRERQRLRACHVRALASTAIRVIWAPDGWALVTGPDAAVERRAVAPCHGPLTVCPRSCLASDLRLA